LKRLTLNTSFMVSISDQAQRRHIKLWRLSRGRRIASPWWPHWMG